CCHRVQIKYCWHRTDQVAGCWSAKTRPADKRQTAAPALHSVAECRPAPAAPDAVIVNHRRHRIPQSTPAVPLNAAGCYQTALIAVADTAAPAPDSAQAVACW